MTKRYGGSVGGKQTKRKSHKYLRKKHRATKRAYRRRHKRAKSIRAKRRTRVNKIRNMHGGVVGLKGALLTSALTGAAGAHTSGNKASLLDGAIDKAAGPWPVPASQDTQTPALPRPQPLRTWPDGQAAQNLHVSWPGPWPVPSSGPWANLGMNKEDPTAKPPSTKQQQQALSKRRNQGNGQGEDLGRALQGKVTWDSLMTGPD